MFISKTKSKTLKFLIIIISLCLVVITIFLFIPKNESYNKFSKSRLDFGIITYETINHEISKYELKQSEKPLEKVRLALNYNGYKEDCYLGTPLEDLCIFKDDFDYTDIKCDISLVTFNIKNDIGYLWFTYDREMIIDNKTSLNEYDILCLVEFRQTGNNWIAQKILSQKK